jgi:hypothetical protein
MDPFKAFISNSQTPTQLVSPLIAAWTSTNSPRPMPHKHLPHKDALENLEKIFQAAYKKHSKPLLIDEKRQNANDYIIPATPSFSCPP